MAQRLRQIDDTRQAGKVDYSVHDCLMSAFPMMLFQDPSLLAFQRRLEQSAQQNNLKALFKVNSNAINLSHSLIIRIEFTPHCFVIAEIFSTRPNRFRC